MTRIDKIVTHGTFELDGGSWEVDNNIWLIGDDSDVVVFDAAHTAEPIVAAALQEEGSLPMLLVDGQVVARGAYPDRRTLADLLGLEPPPERKPLTVLS